MQPTVPSDQAEGHFLIGVSDVAPQSPPPHGAKKSCQEEMAVQCIEMTISGNIEFIMKNADGSVTRCPNVF